jgi:hypothetical protein
MSGIVTNYLSMGSSCLPPCWYLVSVTPRSGGLVSCKPLPGYNTRVPCG